MSDRGLELAGSLTYTPRIWCRASLHQGPWSKPYLVHIRTTTTIQGEFPRESIELVAEEQHQDRTCLHCGAVDTRRLK